MRRADHCGRKLRGVLGKGKGAWPDSGLRSPPGSSADDRQRQEASWGGCCQNPER